MVRLKNDMMSLVCLLILFIISTSSSSVYKVDFNCINRKMFDISIQNRIAFYFDVSFSYDSYPPNFTPNRNVCGKAGP